MYYNLPQIRYLNLLNKSAILTTNLLKMEPTAMKFHSFVVKQVLIMNSSHRLVEISVI